MIISRTSRYAIQALTCLAIEANGRKVLSHDIAHSLNVSQPYLAKVLQGLCRARLVKSSRGRRGGFSLVSGAEHLNLLEIVRMTDGHRADRECLLGLKACQDETACPMHGKWKAVKKDIHACLGDITVMHLAMAVKSGQYRLADLPEVLGGR